MSRRFKRVGRLFSRSLIYSNTLSACIAISCSISLIQNPCILQCSLSPCAKVSKYSAKKVGDKGHFWWVDLSSFIRSARCPFIFILAVGAEQPVLKLWIDFSLKPNRCKTKTKYSQTQSKAFLLPTPRLFCFSLIFCIIWRAWYYPVWRPCTKPVWSLSINSGINKSSLLDMIEGYNL